MVQKPRAQELAPEIKKEIQEELLLASFVGKYEIIPPAKSTNGLPVEVEKRDLNKFNKTFANLIEKHGVENVYSVASALDKNFLMAASYLSMFTPRDGKKLGDEKIATEFEVSKEFARKTKMEIKNGKLEWDPDASAKLYKAKRQQSKTTTPDAMLQRLRNALQKHKKGTSTGSNEAEMTSQTRPSIQPTYNPMRRGSNGQGSSGPGIGG